MQRVGITGFVCKIFIFGFVLCLVALTSSAFSSPAEAHSRRLQHHYRHEARRLGPHHHVTFRRLAGRFTRHHARFAGRGHFRPRGFADATAPIAPLGAFGGARGMASFYGGRGRTASNGHVGAATCAHRTLPFGTVVRITNLRNSRSMLLTVNDRGPFVRGRIVDVSVTAAAHLDIIRSGTAPVALQVVGRGG